MSAAELPEAFRGRRRITGDETFRFACHSGVPCFNQCCTDVNILLTPLDVLRLARRTGLHTRIFLAEHTLAPITKDLHLPVRMLKMLDDEKKSCPFVGEAGCTVYEDRPWACRMYPIGMAVPPAHAGEQPEPVFVVFEDDFCHGREAGPGWTVDAWREDQGVESHEAMERGFRDVVAHPWFIGGRQLDPKRMELFHLAAYDLDSFRTFIFESTFLQRFELEDELVERIRTDDEELLAFAFRWLRFALFAEPTLTVRPGVPSGRKP